MEKVIVKKISLLLIIAILFSFTLTVFADEGEIKLTIIHTNDMHGNPEAVPYVRGLANQLKAVGENVLLVDAGDALNSTAFSSYEDATNMVTIMNIAGYDVYTIGNHEGYMSDEAFAAAAELADFPFLGANVGAEYRTLGNMQDYVIYEIQGVKIAFIGLTVGNHTELNGDAAVACANAAKAAAEAEGATLFIGVFHLGITDTDVSLRSTYVAERCGWLAAIIDAHCHTPYTDTVNGVYMVETGEYSNSLGRLELSIQNGRVTNVSSELVAIKGNEANCGITPDTAIQAYIDTENEKLSYLQEIVATFPIALDGERNTVRAKESVLGNNAADAMLYYTGSDIAFLPGPFIRNSIAAGDMTREEMQGVFMQAETIAYICQLSGDKIITFLETCLAGVPEVSSNFRQIGGIQVLYDSGQAAGNRVVSVTMANGDELKPEQIYQVVCTDMDRNSFTENGWELAYTEHGTSINQMFADYVKVNLAAGGIDGRLRGLGDPIPPAPEPLTAGMQSVYVVQKGDNLWKIAKKLLGSGERWQEILDLNKGTISNADKIYIGQELLIPG